MRNTLEGVRMGRIEVLYRLRVAAGEAQALARAVAIELTVEVPEGLLERYPAIEKDIVARLESLEEIAPGLHEVRLSIDPTLAAGGLPQLLNALSGNVSMLPSVELVDASIPDSILSQFPGPRFGIEGIRSRLGVPGRPIISTALKPRGAPIEDLVAIAEGFAAGGGEVLKDDHNLNEARFEDYRERVLRVRDAVRRGSEISGGRCLYFALLLGPLPELERRLQFLASEGIEGVLVAPMLLGLEGTRALLAGTDRIVWTHPSFTGAIAHPSGGGISPSFLHGVLFRAIGADAVVFANHGGRFPAAREECLALAAQCRRSRGSWRPSFPVPAGGMRFDRIDSLVGDFGADTIFLIGGDLLISEDGVEAGTRAFKDRVRSRFE